MFRLFSRISEFPAGRPSTSTKTSTTPSPTVGIKQGAFPALFAPLQGAQFASAAVATLGNVVTTTTTNIVSKDPPSSSDAEVEDELNKLSLSERNSESSASELPVLPTPNPTPTPPPITKVTPPPVEEPGLVTIETQTQPIELECLSPARESSLSEEGDENNAATEGEFEAEVDSEIQEVQIELIESTTGYEKLCESQEEVELSPPTIQIVPDNDGQEVEDTTSTEHLGSDEKDETLKENISKSPSTEVAVSAKASPETEVEITLTERPSSTSCEQKQSPETQEHEGIAADDEEELEELSTSPTKPADAYSTHEELSPTTDEYQEGLQFGDDGKDDYDLADSESNAGYIPPAPTPAPSMAPLAEMDTDTVDDECSEELKPKESSPLPEKLSKLPVCSSIPKVTTEEVKRKRKKRHLESKKSISGEDKDKATTSTAVTGVAVSTATTGAAATATGTKDNSAKTEADITTVCPWEDE